MLEYLKVSYMVLPFLIYINDLTEDYSSNAKLFVEVRLCYVLYMTLKLLQIILIKI